MVVIPAGSFMMGSPANEPEWQSYGVPRGSYELPQHGVTLGPFAIGKTEVTFAQWDACVAAGGCNAYKPSDQGWGRGSRPVVNVSWKDAQAYIDWLGRETGQPYRLPSEAEWEYAARAGTTTRYAFGDAITPKDANYGLNVGKTTEVGTYPPNAFGLYDMHGNVWEWVEDVWHDSYSGAPTDGSAWTDGKGENSSRNRVDRGGSWDDYQRSYRSAGRNWIEPDIRYVNLGFRVARTLD
jgi:formylglycine-generating enzyme required for sulfatase activity